MNIENFTLSDLHCTAVFYRDKSGFSYKVEISSPENDEAGAIVLPSTYDLRKIGEEMIAFADKAENLPAFVMGGAP